MSFNELQHIYIFYQKHGGDPDAICSQWKQILEGGHDPNEEWESKYERRRASPLFSAVLDNHTEQIELLLQHGADPNKHNPEGRTALQEAVILAHESTVQLLLDQGAKHDTRVVSDFLYGGTALHVAVIEGLPDIVENLLNHGADPLAKTQVGWTPVDVAILDHQKTTLEVLLKKVDLGSKGMRSECTQPSIGHDKLDRHAVASHLLEHGVRHTELSHVSLFHTNLSEILNPHHYDSKSIEQSSRLLISEMDEFLKKEAGISGAVAWNRKLCGPCLRFNTQDSSEILETFEHHLSLTALKKSSEDGCNFCQFLVESLDNHWCLLHQIERKWRKRFEVDPRVRLTFDKRDHVSSRMGEYRLVVICGEKIAFMDLDHVQKRINNAVTGTSPSDTEGTGSDRSIAVAKAWMQRCEDEHPSCRRTALGMLPTRVIDVGSETSSPRIHLSTGECAPYVVLSYCWGHDQNIRLLSTNIDTYKDCIPSTLLPQTIADAITITRKMNIRYLWVDALCILQDSDEDLLRELPEMGRIFSDAWFTIAAKDSASCAGGCFQQRSWPTSAIVPLDIRLPSKTIERESDIHGITKNTRTSYFNRLMAFSKHRTGRSDRDKPVLVTRGWTLQEELLSRRILNCGREELSWICLESSCTETSPEEDDIRSYHRWQYALRPVLAKMFVEDASHSRAKQEEIFNYWLEAVEDFLKRELSEPRDRLTALNGVQSAIGMILGDTQLAGIWKETFFAASLLWVMREAKTGESCMPYSCPSWSWAAHSRPVNYARVPYGKTNPSAWYHDVKYFPEVVAWNIEDYGLEGIGRCVTLRCKLLRESDMDCVKHVVEGFPNRPPQGMEGGEEINLQVHHDSEDAASVSDGWLMLVRTNRFVPGVRDRHYSDRYDIETHLLRLKKLDPSSEDFGRIGLVVTKSWANKWLEKAKEETIRLF